MTHVVSMEQRFWARVERTDSCWLWKGKPSASGYGWIVSPSKRMVKVHRYSAMLHFGMFDRRLFVCHHCDVPLCVNPAHLYLGTAADNARDRETRRRGKAAWTHCTRGHEFTEENTYRWGGKRQCIACRRAYDSARHAHAEARR